MLRKFPWTSLIHIKLSGVVAVIDGFLTDGVANPEHDDIWFLLEISYKQKRMLKEVFVITDGDEYHICTHDLMEVVGDECHYRSKLLWQIRRPPKIAKNVIDRRIQEYTKGVGDRA